MALIKEGSLNNFSVENQVSIPKEETPNLSVIKTFADLAELTQQAPDDAFTLALSAEPRGLAIKSILLQEGFEGFMGNLLKSTNELYFVGYAYDLSGKPACQYPGPGIDPSSVLIPIRVGKVREFIGEGINIFPKRIVAGGMAIRIQLFESDQGIRNFGKTLVAVQDAISQSKLNNVLSLINLGTAVSGATINLIKDAALELSKVVGVILQANSDDFVDFFEGYYAADAKWIPGEDVYNGNSSVITLDKY